MDDALLAAAWIDSALTEGANYPGVVEDQVRSLQRDLQLLQCMLQALTEVYTYPDLTHGELSNFAQEMIRELAFRAEDAIDSYILQVSTKIHMKNLFLKMVCLITHVYPVHRLIEKIAIIRQDIQQVSMKINSFGGIDIVPKISANIGSSSSSRTTPVNYAHLYEEVVVGIDDAIRHLVRFLVDLEQDFKVIGIVGTQGAGKTTLAAQLYNHTQVNSRFPNKAFVSISPKWNRVDVLRRIFRDVKVGGEIPSSYIELVRELYDFLNRKPCLIVLDDMWEKEAWDDICPILPHSNKGCKVIITTPIEDVAYYAHNRCIIHKPRLLTEDEKWELFSKVAMEGRVGIENNAEFERLARQMLGKLEGLPLAVVTLAGVSRTKNSLYQWEEVSKSTVEYVLKGMGKPHYRNLEGMLELSYLDLPNDLKPCFLYFALFPKDWTFYPDSVTLKWIAEGFVKNYVQKEQETLEDVAMQLLEELAQRCVLQVTIRNIGGQIENFQVHGLMREFCIKKAKESQFVGSVSSMLGSRKPRRATILPREIYPQEHHQLRTIVNLGYASEELPPLARGNLESIPNFKLLRVLCIQDLDYDALPYQIGNLIHLRYLSIVGTKISVLPKSIRNLRYLLYLFYVARGPMDMVAVPDGLVGNMENLRQLTLPDSLKRGSLHRLGLSGPKNLQRLRAGAGPWMAKDLPKLSRSVKTLEIYGIEETEEIDAIYQCSGITEGGVSTLRCDYTASGLEFDLKKLMQSRKLLSLELNGLLKGRWEGTIRFPPTLVRLSLSGSMIEEWPELMKVLGDLPVLKYLSLSYGAYLGKQLCCATGAFPVLQEFHLVSLEILEEWSVEKGAMSSLRKIVIEHCLKLKKLPESIRTIPNLRELQIASMPEEFCKRLYGEEDSHIIQHIPNVTILS